MNESFTASFKGDHVRVDSYGQRSIEHSTAMWTEAIRVCGENNCHFILGVSNAPGPLTIVDGFDHVELFRKLDIRDNYRIAWADPFDEARSITEFIETVLANRGFHSAKVFSNEEDARQWLFEETS